jgi:hypothetical protein
MVISILGILLSFVLVYHKIHMLPTHTFSSSERWLVRRQRLFIALLSIIVILPLGTFLFVAGFRLDRFIRALPFLIPATLGPALLGAFLNRYIIRQSRDLSLTLSPTAIERRAGSQHDFIPWQDIIKVQVRERPDGQPQAIVVTPSKGSPITIFGFEPMEEVLNILKHYLPATVPLEAQRAKVNVDNPFTLVGILLLSACVVGLLFWLVGGTTFQVVFPIFQLGFGLYLLVYQPGSRINPALRKLDVGFGILLIGGSVLILTLRVIEWLGWIS